MPQGKASAEETRPATRAHSYATREIPGLASLFLAVIAFLALISFHVDDPSFSSYSTGPDSAAVQNYIGLAGAYLSALFIDLLGLSAFWLVLGAADLVVAIFFGAGLSSAPGWSCWGWCCCSCRPRPRFP